MKKFSKPPLSLSEKEKKAEEFLNFFDKPAKNFVTKDVIILDSLSTDTPQTLIKKEANFAFSIRVPQSLLIVLEEIGALTGLTRNAICIELLRVSAKAKLKDIKHNE